MASASDGAAVEPMAKSAGARADGSPFAPRVASFLLAEALSGIGSWATIVAIWGYAAYEYDATPGDVALFGLAFSVPGVVLGPLVGSVVDRIGPKATMAIAKVIGVVASLALLAADDFRVFAVLSALHGVALVFTMPALQSMPPRLVADEHLARTNALVSLTDELAIVLGPVAAGVGIAAFGFRGAFVFDAATYALGLAVLPLVRLRPRAVAEDRPDEASEGSFRVREVLAGWRLVAGVTILRRTVLCTFAVHFLYGLALLAEPLYVRDVLGRSEAVFAALQTVFGVFLVIGGVIAARLGERLASFRFVALGVVASGISAVVYLGTPLVTVAFVGVSLWGVATALISGPSRTVLQRSSPETAHGRVLAADFVAGSSAELVGVAAGGLVVTVLGVSWSALTVGLAVALVAAVLYGLDQRVPQPVAVAAAEAAP
jgi:MFS family permease